MSRWAAPVLMAPVLAAPVLMAAGLVGAGLLLRRAGLDLGAMLPDRGGRGAAVFMAAAAAALLLGLPRQTVAFAGGAVFGAGPGGALAWGAAMASCATAFYAVRAAWRRPPATPGWLRRAEAALRTKPFVATLALRLLPVGHNMILTMACAALRVRAAPFLLGSAVGYVPQTAVFALLGGGAALGRAASLSAGAALLAASLLGGYALRGLADAPVMAPGLRR